MAIHGLKPMARARSASAIARQSSVWRMTRIPDRERTSQVLRSAIASLRVRVCKPTAYAVRRLLGRWRRTRHALGREPHARLEAARVHRAAGGAADAWPSRRARQSLHDDRGLAAAMNRWRPIAALAAI